MSEIDVYIILAAAGLLGALLWIWEKARTAAARRRRLRQREVDRRDQELNYLVELVDEVREINRRLARAAAPFDPESPDA